MEKKNVGITINNVTAVIEALPDSFKEILANNGQILASDISPDGFSDLGRMMRDMLIEEGIPEAEAMAADQFGVVLDADLARAIAARKMAANFARNEEKRRKEAEEKAAKAQEAASQFAEVLDLARTMMAAGEEGIFRDVAAVKNMTAEQLSILLEDIASRSTFKNIEDTKEFREVKNYAQREFKTYESMEVDSFVNTDHVYRKVALGILYWYFHMDLANAQIAVREAMDAAALDISKEVQFTLRALRDEKNVELARYYQDESNKGLAPQLNICEAVKDFEEAIRNASSEETKKKLEKLSKLAMQERSMHADTFDEKKDHFYNLLSDSYLREIEYEARRAMSPMYAYKAELAKNSAAMNRESNLRYASQRVGRKGDVDDLHEIEAMDRKRATWLVAPQENLRSLEQQAEDSVNAAVENDRKFLTKVARTIGYKMENISEYLADFTTWEMLESFMADSVVTQKATESDVTVYDIAAALWGYYASGAFKENGLGMADYEKLCGVVVRNRAKEEADASSKLHQFNSAITYLAERSLYYGEIDRSKMVSELKYEFGKLGMFSNYANKNHICWFVAVAGDKCAKVYGNQALISLAVAKDTLGTEFAIVNGKKVNKFLKYAKELMIAQKEESEKEGFEYYDNKTVWALNKRYDLKTNGFLTATAKATIVEWMFGNPSVAYALEKLGKTEAKLNLKNSKGLSDDRCKSWNTVLQEASQKAYKLHEEKVAAMVKLLLDGYELPEETEERVAVEAKAAVYESRRTDIDAAVFMIVHDTVVAQAAAAKLKELLAGQVEEADITDVFLTKEDFEKETSEASEDSDDMFSSNPGVDFACEGEIDF